MSRPRPLCPKASPEFSQCPHTGANAVLHVAQVRTYIIAKRDYPLRRIYNIKAYMYDMYIKTSNTRGSPE